MKPICENNFTVPNTELTSCAFCVATPNFVTCGSDGKVHYHEITNKGRRTDFKGGRSARTAVACIHPDDPATPLVDCVFSGDASGHVFRSKLSIRSQRISFTPHSSSVNSIHFTPDQSRFTTSSNDGSAKVWDTGSCKFLSSLRAHKSWVTTSTFSPDANVIITCSLDKHVRLWDVRSTTCSQVFGPLRAGVTRATFHPDGNIIGTALDNGCFSILDTRNQQVIQTYDRAHIGAITSLQFHPAGAFALTTGLDKKVRIWDLLEGQLFYTIEAHKAAVSDGKWNKDGSRFLTCDRAGVVLQWQTHFDKLVETIEIETRADDTVEQRLRKAMDITAPSPRDRVPEPTPMQAEPPSRDFIEASLTRMVNQVEMLVKTATMMDRRTGMLEEKLSQLQTKRKP
jgi:centriolar protein POC1